MKRKALLVFAFVSCVLLCNAQIQKPIFGYFKRKVTGQPAFAGAIKVTLIGAVAAAFFAAKLFSN